MLKALLCRTGLFYTRGQRSFVTRSVRSQPATPSFSQMVKTRSGMSSIVSVKYTTFQQTSTKKFSTKVKGTNKNATKHKKSTSKEKKVATSPEPAKGTVSPGKQRLASYVELSGPTEKPPQKNWKQVYEIFVELRKDRSAPVDFDGSEALPIKGKDFQFQTLICLMLSSQTKDQMVGSVIRRLQKHGLSIENIAHTSDAKLGKLIYGVGFHNKKVVYIRKTVNILIEKHGGEVPDNLKDLISLPGVGPKMAIIVLNVAFNKQVGISVDTHLHRICAQLGWTKSPKTPEHTRRQLESWMPRPLWGDINLLLVGVAQEVQQQPEKLYRKCLMLNSESKQKLAIDVIKRLGVDVKAQELKVAKSK